MITPLPPVKILQASAGSGKTYSLTLQYLNILFYKPNAYREILALTFTNKATNEMRERIMHTLKSIAQGDEKTRGIAEQIISSHTWYTPESLQQAARDTYRKILHDFKNFSVDTIDGFVQKVVRSFTFELGINSAYELQMDADMVVSDIAAMLNKKLDDNGPLLNWVADLVTEQINNNESWNYSRALAALARQIFNESFEPFEAALSGKTGEELDKVFADLQQQTKDIIKNFEDSIKSLCEPIVEIVGTINDADLVGKTRSPLYKVRAVYNGDGGKMEDVLKIGEPAGWFKPKAMYDDDTMNACYSYLQKLQAFYKKYSPDYVLAIRLKNSFYYLRLVLEMNNILAEYRETKGVMLISDTQKLLRRMLGAQGANPSFIWEKMGSRYKYFLFDEFQDTSKNQYENLRPLVENALAAAEGKIHEHLVVGDVKQAIYRWRNGDWQLLQHKITEDLGAANIQQDSLDSNYRSAANIIMANNLLFKTAAEGMQRLLTARLNDADDETIAWWKSKGYNTIIQDVYAHVEQKTHSKTLPGGTVIMELLQDDEGKKLNNGDFTLSAFNSIAENISRLHSQRGIPYGEMAVLVRDNSLAAAGVAVLMDYGIPVISNDAFSLSANLAVKLIVAMLRALGSADSQNSIAKATCVSIYHMLNKQEVPADRLAGLAAKPLHAYEGLLPETLLQNYRLWTMLPLQELVDMIIMAYGMHGADYADHLLYMLSFKDAVVNYCNKGDKGITDFLNWYDAEGHKTTVPSADDSDGVNIITLHKSKGLAYNYVFMLAHWELGGKADMVWYKTENTSYAALGSLPVKTVKDLARSSIAREYMEELLMRHMDALNMLYVGATRAAHYLHVYIADEKEGNIGTVILPAFRQAEAYKSYMVNNNTLVLDEPVQYANNPARGTEISINEYYRTPQLYRNMYEQAAFIDLPDERYIKAQLQGTILHTILERHTAGDELESLLDAMELEGLVANEEKESYRQRALKIINTTDMQTVLQMPGEVLKEQTLVDTDGRAYRPDRLIINGNEATVVDYKFTLRKHTEHVEQVSKYKQLLADMGYSPVTGYLYYAFEKKLSAV